MFIENVFLCIGNRILWNIILSLWHRKREEEGSCSHFLFLKEIGVAFFLGLSLFPVEMLEFFKENRGERRKRAEL